MNRFYFGPPAPMRWIRRRAKWIAGFYGVGRREAVESAAVDYLDFVGRGHVA